MTCVCFSQCRNAVVKSSKRENTSLTFESLCSPLFGRAHCYWHKRSSLKHFQFTTHTQTHQTNTTKHTSSSSFLLSTHISLLIYTFFPITHKHKNCTIMGPFMFSNCLARHLFVCSKRVSVTNSDIFNGETSISKH